MKIELPTEFSINYVKLKNKRYYNSNNKSILCNELLAVSKSYCMYCGKSLLNESDWAFHMEHSVDKGGNDNQSEKKTFLYHCKFNFSVACSYCNIVCKKIVQKIDLENAESVDTCIEKTCDKMCDMYRKHREQYAANNAIILQPQGIISHGSRLKIFYDLIQNIYEADSKITEDEDLFFISNHIRRFQLNGLRFSESIIDLCADIVVLFEDGITNIAEILRFLKSRRCTNIIAENFIKYCETGITDIPTEKFVEFCRLVVILNAAD